MSEVFAVVPYNPKTAQSTEGDFELVSFKSSSFCIYTVKRSKKHKWRDKRFVFDCEDSCLCQEWIDNVQSILSGILECICYRCIEKQEARASIYTCAGQSMGDF